MTSKEQQPILNHKDRNDYTSLIDCYINVVINRIAWKYFLWFLYLFLSCTVLTQLRFAIDSLADKVNELKGIKTANAIKMFA